MGRRGRWRGERRSGEARRNQQSARETVCSGKRNPRRGAGGRAHRRRHRDGTPRRDPPRGRDTRGAGGRAAREAAFRARAAASDETATIPPLHPTRGREEKTPKTKWRRATWRGGRKRAPRRRAPSGRRARAARRRGGAEGKPSREGEVEDLSCADAPARVTRQASNGTQLEGRTVCEIFCRLLSCWCVMLVDLSLRSVRHRGFPREILVAGLLDARERLFPRRGCRSSLGSRATHPPPPLPG